MPMPIGTILLIICALLVHFGLAERVLDGMCMTDRAALVVIALLIGGSLINFRLAPPPAGLVVNVGGAIIPVAVALWPISTADESVENVTRKKRHPEL